MAQTFFLCSGLKLHQKPFSALISPPPMIHTEHGAYLALDVDAIRAQVAAQGPWQ